VTVQSDLDELLDDPDLILRQTRERFISAFPGRAASIVSLASSVAMLGVSGPLEALRHLVHRLTATAGIAAMPTLRGRSVDLEQLVAAVGTGFADPASLAPAVRALTLAFEHELQQPAPPWAKGATDDAAVERILVVDDDRTQCGPLRAALLEAGYRPFIVPADTALYDAIRVVSAALVLVNADRAGADGYALCWHLKATPEFATLPLICATARLGINTGREIADERRTNSSAHDRLITSPAEVDAVGVAMLRADDYAPSGGDPRDLVQCITATLRHRASTAGMVLPSGLLTYEAFVVAAQDLLRREAGSLVVARLARDRVWAMTAYIISHARPRDLIGWYDERHLVLYLPGVLPAAAGGRVREILATGRAGRAGRGPAAAMAAGVAGTNAPGRGGLFDRLLIDADHALAIAVARGELVVTR
jgi:DNA-binding response OmpR family regulator